MLGRAGKHSGQCCSPLPHDMENPHIGARVGCAIPAHPYSNTMSIASCPSPAALIPYCNGTWHAGAFTRTGLCDTSPPLLQRHAGHALRGDPALPRSSHTAIRRGVLARPQLPGCAMPAHPYSKDMLTKPNMWPWRCCSNPGTPRARTACVSTHTGLCDTGPPILEHRDGRAMYLALALLPRCGMVHLRVHTHAQGYTIPVPYLTAMFTWRNMWPRRR